LHNCNDNCISNDLHAFAGAKFGTAAMAAAIPMTCATLWEPKFNDTVETAATHDAVVKRFARRCSDCHFADNTCREFYATLL